MWLNLQQHAVCWQPGTPTIKAGKLDLKWEPHAAAVKYLKLSAYERQPIGWRLDNQTGPEIYEKFHIQPGEKVMKECHKLFK